MWSSVEWRGAPFAEALAGQIDAVCVVNDAIQDGIGQGRISYYFIPAVHGDLARDEDRTAIVAILDDFEQVPAAVGAQGFRAPVINDEQRCARQRAQHLGVAAVAPAKRQHVEQLGRTVVGHGQVFPACLLAKGTSDRSCG